MTVYWVWCTRDAVCLLRGTNWIVNIVVPRRYNWLSCASLSPGHRQRLCGNLTADQWDAECASSSNNTHRHREWSKVLWEIRSERCVLRTCHITHWFHMHFTVPPPPYAKKRLLLGHLAKRTELWTYFWELPASSEREENRMGPIVQNMADITSAV